MQENHQMFMPKREIKSNKGDKTNNISVEHIAEIYCKYTHMNSKVIKSRREINIVDHDRTRVKLCF